MTSPKYARIAAEVSFDRWRIVAVWCAIWALRIVGFVAPVWASRMASRLRTWAPRFVERGMRLRMCP